MQIGKTEYFPDASNCVEKSVSLQNLLMDVVEITQQLEGNNQEAIKNFSASNNDYTITITAK